MVIVKNAVGPAENLYNGSSNNKRLCFQGTPQITDHVCFREVCLVDV